ncbi:MAG: AEC family transporter [Oscillospiraceae bacterium]|nr:AEC family transporter [Oscillospiraceae bacterium]
MDRIIAVAEVVAPIFTAIGLGMIARKRELLSRDEVRGLQQFVMKFGLPCVIFNSCLTAQMGTQSLSSMALVILTVVISTFWAFGARKKRYPYHNLPQLFTAQETGMLGIPLFMILFGADQAYRMGMLDLAQAVTAYPVIAILSADAGENPSVKQIVKKVMTSPLMIMCLLGLFLNLTGIGGWLNTIGIGGMLTESATFLSQPISAMMIFSVGYNFSMSGENRGDIFKVAGIHFVYFAVACAAIQGILFLIPGVDALTRWAVLLYCTLPASYLAPGLGRSERDYTLASGVCSVLTVVTLLVFCVMAAFAV